MKRTARAVAASPRARARMVRYRPMSSCGRRDAGPSYPWPRRAGLLTPAPPLAWHESATVKRQKGGGGAVHASSWAGRRGGEAVLGPLIVRVQRGLHPVLWPRVGSCRSQNRWTWTRGSRTKSPWSVGSAKREWPSGRRWGVGEKHAGPLPGAPTVGVLPPGGVTPTSKLVCVFPVPDGDARMIQRFILVRAKEGPTSSGGDVFYYLAPKCLYRGEYRRVLLRILSPRR